MVFFDKLKKSIDWNDTGRFKYINVKTGGIQCIKNISFLILMEH